MSEETRINPEHLTELLPLLADDVLDGIAACMGKGWKRWVRRETSHKFKSSELAEIERAVRYIVMALQMGLLLAKRQMELGDVALSMLKSRGVSADEVWQPIIEEYHAFLRTIGEEDSGRDSISPNHFGEFLAYFASHQLMEMSQFMDDEWQRAWRKRENPFKLNLKEKAKLVHVGNSATFAIAIGLLVAKRQPELLMVDWSRGGSLDVLWEGILHDYQRFLYYKHFVVCDKSSGGDEMSEQKMMDLLAQGYSIKQVAEMLGRDEGFVKEITGEGWGQFDFGMLIGKRVLVKEKLKEPRSERVAIGTSTVVIKEVSPSGDRVLLERPVGHSIISLWAEVRNLKIIKQLDDEKHRGEAPIREQVSEELSVEPEGGKELMPRSASGVRTTPVEAVAMSPQLESFCSDYTTALGIALDVAIRVGRQEHEAGFNEAMYMLSKGGPGLHGRNPFRFGVLEEDKPRMLAEIKRYADEAGIPYNKTSPLNQFIVTIPPYIFYCLEQYLPDDPDLREEARRLMNTKGFPRYLQEELGYPISQRIKGAFWRPNPFGFVARRFGPRRRH